MSTDIENRLGGPGGGMGLGVWNELGQTITHKVGKQIDNKVLPHSTGSSCQCLVINHNRKEYGKECVYICACICACIYIYVYIYIKQNHFTV